MAHSGALLSGDPSGADVKIHGEVPFPWPSVTRQIRRAPRGRGGKVRILLEGGLNEVGGGRISSPTTSSDYISKATKDSCYTKLKKVLGEVTARFPEAEIYVLGYYQILADRATPGEVGEMLKEEGAAEEEIAGIDFDLRGKVAENSGHFRELSDRWIRAAVEEVAEGYGGSCVFVPSGFKEWEGMFGEPSLLFSPWTRDPMRSKRAKHCTVAIAKGETGLHCYFAAAGHPNEDGIARYVEGITAAMEEQSRD